MIKAIIFDMDGVISNTENARFSFLKNELKIYDIELSDKDIKKMIGKKTKLFLKEVSKGKLNDSEIDDIYNKRKREFHKTPEKHIRSYPDALRCIKRLKKEIYTLTIASSANIKEIRKVLQLFNLISYFKFIIGADDVIEHKPHPEIYLKTVEKLGLQKKECFVIEDSTMGVIAARKAGLYCVGVTHTHSKEELLNAGADAIIDSLDEIDSEFIKKISENIS